MKNCSICHKISASDQDHLDCIQKRSIEMEDVNFKKNIPEKLNLSKNTQDLDVGVRAILEHLAKKKSNEDEL
jgi:arsenate reductase-like glutaredoxin family protein